MTTYDSRERKTVIYTHTWAHGKLTGHTITKGGIKTDGLKNKMKTNEIDDL